MGPTAPSTRSRSARQPGRRAPGRHARRLLHELRRDQYEGWRDVQRGARIRPLDRPGQDLVVRPPGRRLRHGAERDVRSRHRGVRRPGDSLFDVAVDPRSGAVYAVWEDGRFNGVDEVAFSKSTDGGLTWTTPRQIAETPASTNPLDEQAFTPSIDVSDDGTVAVNYYDFRNNTAAPGVPTDYWAITSSNGGTTWSPEIRPTGSSFDGELAPNAGGAMIGDHEGLTHTGSTFIAAFEVTNPADIQLARFTP
jgi:hypothetical protein